MKAATENGVASAVHEGVGPAVDQNGGLVRVHCSLTGLTPLLMNAMSEEQLLAIRDKVKKPRMASKPSLRDEAASKVHLLSDGRPHMPIKALYSCLINAGQFIRLDGKRQITTAKATVLPGMLTLEDVTLPLHIPGTENAPVWEVDIQQGRNPNGGEAVCIVRPRFDQWEIRCTLEIDQQQMTVSMAQELVSIAGRRIGLLDARPQRRGTFGRFTITSWKVDRLAGLTA